MTVELIYPDDDAVWEDVKVLQQYRSIGNAMDVPKIIARIHATKAWLMIGYDNWDDLCIEQFGGWVPNLGIEDRREVVSELTEAGLSTRAIGSALGVDDRTVRRDQGAANAAPVPVQGLDGKTYKPKPKPTRDDILAEYPVLDVPDAADADIARVAEGLAKIPECEREERAEYGRRWLAAKTSGALDDIHSPDPCAPADEMVKAALTVCRTTRRNGGDEAFVVGWDHADSVTRENWLASLREAAAVIDRLVNAIPAPIRRVQ